MINGAFDPGWKPIQILGYTLLALLFGAVVVLAVGSSRRAPVVRFLEQPVLRAFGRYSYAMYLVHVQIFLTLQGSFFRPGQLLSMNGSELPGQLLFYVVAISSTLLAGWICWNAFEKHFLALKRFFPRRQDPEEFEGGTKTESIGVLTARSAP